MAGAEEKKGGGGGKMQAKLIEKFPKSSFLSGRVLGQGAFGSVVEGKHKGKDVVVKILHGTIGQKRFSILDDMYRLEHRNLVKLIGLIDTGVGECPQMVFQYIDAGNLLDFVKNKKHLDPNMKSGTLLKLAKDVVEGCDYLHRMEFIHGSLAARNILLSRFQQHLNAKISDYGMNRVIDGMGANYFKILNKVIPIRWMPKEAISEVGRVSEVTKASDVWSFGVVLWEMATLGEVPYGPIMSNTEVQQHILKGSSPLTFKKPKDCPPQVFNLMQNIFKTDQTCRPEFADLKIVFTEFHEKIKAAKDTTASNHTHEEKKDKPYRNRETYSKNSETSRPRGGRSSHGSHPYFPDRPGSKGSQQDSQQKDKTRPQGRNDERRTASPYKENPGSERTKKKYEDVRGRSLKSSHTDREGGRQHRRDTRNTNRSKSKTSLYRDYDKEAAHEEKRRIDHSPPGHHSRSDSPRRNGGASATSAAPGKPDRLDPLKFRAPQGLMDVPLGIPFPSAPPAYSEAVACDPPYVSGIYPTRLTEIQPPTVIVHQDKEKELLLESIKQLEQKVAKLEMDSTVNQTVQKRLQEQERQKTEVELLQAITSRVTAMKESLPVDNQPRKNTMQVQPNRNVQKGNNQKGQNDDCIVS